jgi:hypothetical protein
LLNNARKKSKGGDRKSKDQIDTLIDTAEVIANETGTSPASVKRYGAQAKEAEVIRQQEPQLSMEQAMDKAEEAKKSTPKPPAPKPELTPEQKQEALEKLLEKRWGKFIKDIPVTDHSAVREWLNQKLKKSAL